MFMDQQFEVAKNLLQQAVVPTAVSQGPAIVAAIIAFAGIVTYFILETVQKKTSSKGWLMANTVLLFIVYGACIMGMVRHSSGSQPSSGEAIALLMFIVILITILTIVWSYYA